MGGAWHRYHLIYRINLFFPLFHLPPYYAGTTLALLSSYGLSQQTTHASQFVSTPGEAVTVAQEVVTTMVAKGYTLTKDALIKAKALDESYQVSSTAAAKVADLSNRIGLSDKIYAGMEVAKSVDQKYHVSETTMTVASYTGRTAVAAANAVVSSSYFKRGALWVSDALNHAAKVAADLGTQGVKK